MKKSLEYYLSPPYRLSIVPDLEEGGYAAEYPELPGCITCGKTVVEVLELAEDAKNAGSLSHITMAMVYQFRRV